MLRLHRDCARCLKQQEVTPMHARLATLLAATVLLGMASTAGASAHLTASCDADNSGKHNWAYSDQGQHRDRGEHKGMAQGRGHDRDDDQGEDEGNQKDVGSTTV